MPAVSAVAGMPPSRLLLLVVAVAAVAGLSALWAAASAALRDNCSWMALIAALDAALLLRLAGDPPSRARAARTLAITLLSLAAGALAVAVVQLGIGLGLRPAESWSLVNVDLIALYLDANSGWRDLAWAAAGCALAWKAGR